MKSSETICQIPIHIGKDIVRTAWRHAEASATLAAISKGLVPLLKSVTHARAKFLVG